MTISTCPDMTCRFRNTFGYCTLTACVNQSIQAVPRGTVRDDNSSLNVQDITLSKDKFLIGSCPRYGALLIRCEHKNFCGECGQAIKWKIEDKPEEKEE